MTSGLHSTHAIGAAARAALFVPASERALGPVVQNLAHPAARHTSNLVQDGCAGNANHGH